MAQGDPPAKQWADSNGNVEAEIRYDTTTDDFIIQHLGGGNIDFQQSDLSNVSSLNADGINIKSAIAQFGVDGHVVPISPGVGVSDAVPVSNSTPINDAINIINTDGNGSGTVILPPGFFNNDAPIIRSSDNPEGITFLGHGAEDGTEVLINDNTANGIELLSADGTNAGSHISLGGFALRGDSGSRTDGSAIEITSNPERFHLVGDGLRVLRWDNTNVPTVNIDGKLFQSNWSSLKLFNYQGDGLNIDTIGTNNWFGQITVKAPGGNVPVRINRPGGEFTIEQLNVSNDADRVGNIRQAQDSLSQIGTIHFEGTQPSGSQVNLVFLGANDGDINIDHIKVETGSFDYIYDSQSGGTITGRLQLCKPLGIAANNHTLRLRGDLAEPAVFDGKSSEVDNSSGATWTERMWCRGDLVSKQSTDVGFDGGTNDSQI